MKILVPLKRVVDANVRVRVKKDGSGMDIANAATSVNPFDEIALEEAIRLKEAGKAQEVVVASVGPDTSKDVLLKGLAFGADRAILIQTATSDIEPLAVAKLLKSVAEKEGVNLVLMGKQAIDDDCNQTGQMLAALLGWPQATFASKLILNGSSAEVTREVEGGLEKITITLPAVVTADLRLNEPRYLSIMNIMQAKQKPMDLMTPETFGVDIQPRLITQHFTPPPIRKPGVRISSVEELMAVIRKSTYANTDHR